MRWVSTRVLPEPAPATTSSGPVDVGDGLELHRVEADRGIGSGRARRPVFVRRIVPQPVGADGVGRRRHGPPTLPVPCDASGGAHEPEMA